MRRMFTKRGKQEVEVRLNAENSEFVLDEDLGPHILQPKGIRHWSENKSVNCTLVIDEEMLEKSYAEGDGLNFNIIADCNAHIDFSLGVSNKAKDWIQKNHPSAPLMASVYVFTEGEVLNSASLEFFIELGNSTTGSRNVFITDYNGDATVLYDLFEKPYVNLSDIFNHHTLDYFTNHTLKVSSGFVDWLIGTRFYTDWDRRALSMLGYEKNKQGNSYVYNIVIGDAFKKWNVHIDENNVMSTTVL